MITPSLTDFISVSGSDHCGEGPADLPLYGGPLIPADAFPFHDPQHARAHGAKHEYLTEDHLRDARAASRVGENTRGG
jgi:hypothetical protein